MGVHYFLVTAPDHDRMQLWANTSLYANWIEGRTNRHGTETWQVTVMDEQADHFLNAARTIGTTVEELEGAGDDERYLLRVGEPGTGWKKPRTRKAKEA